MSGVRAETRMVPPGHGHLQFYRDLDGVDIDRDESVSAAFFDEYGLPPVHPMRRGYRPSLAEAIRGAMPPVSQTSRPSSAASTHRAAPDTHPSPECSARADSPKENHV